ncbi:unnamed protein product [Strongylus vulgaris]|uniref:Uncharacterized protein n=1 Tax=Strongylus vulgaris TaxID=40348 RepID=A0A3P7KW04_STRVU|nr:unnamed protein product [Strongylus vulgaris]
MQVLQAARLRSVRAVNSDDIAHDIISMSSEPSLPPVPSPTESAQNLIEDLLGPISDSASASTDDDGVRLDSLLNGLDIDGVAAVVVELIAVRFLGYPNSNMSR